MAKEKPYSQRLPAIDLVLEKHTANVPDDGHYYLNRDGEQLGRFRTLKAAQEAWAQAVADSGWQPEPREQLDPRELLIREADMREAERFKEYWGTSHKFRVRGGVHRNR